MYINLRVYPKCRKQVYTFLEGRKHGYFTCHDSNACLGQRRLVNTGCVRKWTDTVSRSACKPSGPPVHPAKALCKGPCGLTKRSSSLRAIKRKNQAFSLFFSHTDGFSFVSASPARESSVPASQLHLSAQARGWHTCRGSPWSPAEPNRLRETEDRQ